MSTRDDADLLRLADEADRDSFARRQDAPMQGPTTVVGVTAQGAANDIQVVSLVGNPDGGTFQLQGRTLPYNATAAQVQTQLLVAYGSGNVACTGGPLPGTPVTVTFQGTLLRTLVTTMTSSAANLTGGTPPLRVRVAHPQRGEPAYPTAARSMYRFQFASAGGDEVSGTAGVITLTSPARYGYALNIGRLVPPSGTALHLTRCGGRWVFHY